MHHDLSGLGSGMPCGPLHLHVQFSCCHHLLCWPSGLSPTLRSTLSMVVVKHSLPGNPLYTCQMINLLPLLSMPAALQLIGPRKALASVNTLAVREAGVGSFQPGALSQEQAAWLALQPLATC